MADTLAGALKQEITRLARKSIKQELGSLQSASSGHRRQIAALKRQVAELERQIRRLRKDTPDRTAAKGADTDAEAPAIRFQARGLKSLRERLGLSAADLARLVGVSGQSIYNWEAGKAKPRRSQMAAVAALRGIGKREIRRRLAANEGPAPAATGQATEATTGRAGRGQAGQARRSRKQPARTGRRARST